MMDKDHFKHIIFCEHLSPERMRPIDLSVITGDKRLMLCPICSYALRGAIFEQIMKDVAKELGRENIKKLFVK